MKTHQRLARPANSVTAMACSDELHEFMQWAVGKGISDAPIAEIGSQNTESCLGYSLVVSNFPDAGGRGLAAARDLRKGELILRVPKRVLMSREGLAKDEEVAILVRKHPNLSSTQVLAVYLLTEVAKGKCSWWYPYLRQLPCSYDVLACFTHFEAQALQVEDAIWLAQRVIVKVQHEWKEAEVLMKEIGLKHRFTTFKSWLWAVATVSSRTLHVPWDGAGCLCPVGDLFNYVAPGVDLEIAEDSEVERESFSSEYSLGKVCQSKECSSSVVTGHCHAQSRTEAKLILNQESSQGLSKSIDNEYSARLTDGSYEPEAGAYCFYARQGYRKGEQVLLCYGVYTNLELLEYYGFLLNDNPNDKVYIQLDDNMSTWKCWKQNDLYLWYNGKPSFSLLAALRFHAAQPNLRKGIGHLVFSGVQISVENDMAAIKWLVEKCGDMIAKLPTTTEEDETLLEIISRCLQDGGIQLILDLLHHSETDQCCNNCVLFDPFPKWVRLSSRGRHIVTGELSTFFNMHCLQKHKEVDFVLERKLRVLLNRWKLAMQWRLGYKSILHRCISYCNGRLEHFHMLGRGSERIKQNMLNVKEGNLN